MRFQKNTFSVTHNNVKYNKLSKGKGSGNRRRINRTTTVAVSNVDANDLMPIIQPTRSEDEDDDDDYDDDDDDDCVSDDGIICKLNKSPGKHRNEQIAFYANTWESPHEQQNETKT